MNKYCVDKWNKNKELLRTALVNFSDKDELSYGTLMQLCVKYILNPDADYDHIYDEDVKCIFGGEFQGCIMFVLVPVGFPDIGDFLVSYIEYGSCAVCDLLENIQFMVEDPEEQLNDLMSLCKDLICNIKKPYNQGWRHKEEFDDMTMDGEEE